MAESSGGLGGAGLGGAAEDRGPEGCSLTQRVRMDRAGRLVVPAGIRKALNLQAGQNLIVSLEGDFVRLQTLDAALGRVRAIARRHRRKEGGSVVDAFIAERRAEAAKGPGGCLTFHAGTPRS